MHLPQKFTALNLRLRHCHLKELDKCHIMVRCLITPHLARTRLSSDRQGTKQHYEVLLRGTCHQEKKPLTLSYEVATSQLMIISLGHCQPGRL
jgi:hypothetical protein